MVGRDECHGAEWLTKGYLELLPAKEDGN